MKGSIKEEIMKYVFCVIYICFSITGLVLMMLGSQQAQTKSLTIPVIGIAVSALSLCGMVCYGISFCLYLGIISRFSLSMVIPILGGIVNILVLIVSYTVLKEEMAMNTVIGAILVIFGIVIMNLNK